MDEPKGGDLEIFADYYGAANEAFLRNAIRIDRALEGKLLGELVINGLTFGTATFRSIQVLKDFRGNGIRIDGKNGLYYCTAVLLWRLH